MRPRALNVVAAVEARGDHGRARAADDDGEFIRAGAGEFPPDVGPHAPGAGCACRKPAPGLLQQIEERYGVSLKGVPYVGDSLRDMQAALTAQCAPHLVLTGRHADVQGEPLPACFPAQTHVHADLAGFVDHLLGQAMTADPTS